MCTNNMFKFKKNKKTKKNNNNKINTLSVNHKMMVDKFKTQYEKLPELKKDLDIYINKLEELKQIPMLQITDTELETKHDLIHKIKNIQNEIKRIESNKEEITYFRNTSNILFHYYSDARTTNVKKSNDGILQYFAKKKINDENNNNSIIVSDTNDNSLIYKYINRNNINKKGFLLNQYMKQINSENITIVTENITNCQNCQIEMTKMQNDGYYVCTSCGEMTYVNIDPEKPSYKDPPPEGSYFPYKKIGRFNEWLSQIQAKTKTDIPLKIFTDLKKEIKKECIVDISKLNNDKIKKMLKKLGYNSYYDHIPYIIFKLNGISPPKLSSEKEATLKNMFKIVLEPFNKVKPKDRKNAPSYAYLLYKFVELLGWDELIPCFNLLKSRKRLHQQDVIWKSICNILKWEYIPSM